MKIKLFGNKNAPACLYCQYGRVNGDGNRVFCSKRGIVDTTDACRLFIYDPLKRTPKKVMLSTELTEKDFEI